MIPNFSIKKPFTIFVAIVMVGILGVVSYFDMTTDLLPDMNFPVAIISTAYPGALPQEVETIVTEPIEKSILSITGIDSVDSVSNENSSLVILTLKDSVDIDAVVAEIREKINLVSPYFPSEVLNSNIVKVNPSMMPVMVTAVSLPNTTQSETSKYINDIISPKISRTEGVATVSAEGILSNVVSIETNQTKIDEINTLIRKELSNQPDNPVSSAGISIPQITDEMIAGIIKGQNFSMSSGIVEDGNQSYFLRVGDKIDSIDELKNLTIYSMPVIGLEKIVLSDVANINIVDNSNNIYAKVNGENAVIITVTKQPDYSTSEVTNNIYKTIDDLKNGDNNLIFTTVMDQGTYVNVMVETILKNIIVGAILASLILLIFFKNFKLTIVVSASILISVVAAYVLMYMSGITLNVISMGGLALGIGMLVDNSIVVIENIYRMRHEGKSIKEAAILGAQQVAGPIFGSTLTTVIVFVPILFTQGFTKQIFGDLALTISFSLLASLLVALTFVPILSQKVITKKTVESKIFNRIRERYIKTLEFALNKKWIVVLMSITLLIISGFTAITLDKELIPQTNTSNVNVAITLPNDSTIEEDMILIDDVVNYTRKIEDVQTVGASYEGNDTVNNEKVANIYIVLEENRTNEIEDISSILRAYGKENNFLVSTTSGSSDISMITGSQIAFNIYSDDLDLLSSATTQITETIASIDGILELEDSAGKEKEEIRVTIDKNKALGYGLTVSQVWQKISEANKQLGFITSIKTDGISYDVRFINEKSKINLDYLEKMIIKSNTSQPIPLSDIAIITKEKTLSSINRSNTKRYVSVTGSVRQGYKTEDINRIIIDKITDLNLPSEVTIEHVGESEIIKSTFSDLILMIILAILFIYLVMVAQFQSMLLPFIVMFTIPLAFTGGFFALFITGTTISVVSLIGLVLLTGVVVNNGIVFVDYANKMIESGLSTREALIKTGRDRIRPVILTAFTTIFAQLALCIDTSETSNMTRGMAVTSIGGLLYATILTLFLVPVLFELFGKKKKI